MAMSMEELQPRSKVLREALDKGKENEPAQAMLTVAEACAHLRISKWTLYRLMQSGKLTSVKIGSRRLIPVGAITKFIEQLEKEGGG
jgi:excisionase family DNA binding protein